MGEPIIGPAGPTRGPVFRPGDDGYDEERTGYQTAFRHRPDLIVGADGPGDVRAAVAHAGEHDLPVAVQATGHGQAWAASEGVLVATRRMSGVRVDPGTRTAWIEAGVRWERVVTEAARHGLAPLSGSAPHVGAVGYTLGGGIGLLARRYGYAADHVQAIDVVTADAELHHVTAESDPDRFWALRGGRSNFGVVTGLRIGLVPVTRLYGGGLYFGTDLLADVLRDYAAWTATVPDSMTSSLALVPFPDVPALPGPLRGRHAAHVRIAYNGDAAEGERLVAPLRAVGPRLIDALGDLPYAEGGTIHNDPVTPMAYDGSNVMLDGFGDGAAGAVLDLAGPDAPLPCIVELRHLGGALARTPEVPSAVGNRDAAFMLAVLSRLGATDAGDVRAAHGRLFGALEPWTTGRSLNFMGGGEHATPDLVRTAYDAADLERLTGLRDRHDPAGRFRLTHVF